MRVVQETRVTNYGRRFSAVKHLVLDNGAILIPTVECLPDDYAVEILVVKESPGQK